VEVIASLGGTTEPVPGTYKYPNGTVIRLKAVPYAGYRFDRWVISGSYAPGHNIPPVYYPENVEEFVPPSLPSPSQLTMDSLVLSQNPLAITCGYGYTFQYQAVFVPIAAPTPPAGDVAIAIVLAGAGGTTDPAPGTYTFTNEPVSLKATADEGFEFLYWVVKGAIPGHDAIETSASLEIICQAGYTFSYQPVFKPSAAALPSAGVPSEYFYAAIIILAIVAVIAIAAAMMFRSRTTTK
jgi:hypothetical protein